MHKQAAPNEEMLERDRKRNIEVRLMQWAEKEGYLDAEFASPSLLCCFLTPSSMPPEKLDAILNEQREKIAKMMADEEEQRRKRELEGPMNRAQREAIRDLPTHQQAALRQQQLRNFGSALGIRDREEEGEEGYREGEAFDRDLQEKVRFYFLDPRLTRVCRRDKNG